MVTARRSAFYREMDIRIVTFRSPYGYRSVNVAEWWTQGSLKVQSMFIYYHLLLLCKILLVWGAVLFWANRHLAWTQTRHFIRFNNFHNVLMTRNPCEIIRCHLKNWSDVLFTLMSWISLEVDTSERTLIADLLSFTFKYFNNTCKNSWNNKYKVFVRL